MESLYKEKQLALDTLRDEILKRREVFQKQRVHYEEAQRVLSELTPPYELEPQLLQLAAEIKSKTSAFQAANEELREVENQLEEINRHKTKLAERLKKSSADKDKVLQKAFRRCNNLERAYKFVNENKSQFVEQVFGPICAEVTCKTQAIADAFEQQVGHKLLLAFVTESLDDAEVLRVQFNRLGCKASVLTVNMKTANNRDGGGSLQHVYSLFLSFSTLDAPIWCGKFFI